MVAIDVVFGMTGGIICTLKATLQKMIINSAVQIVCVDRTAGSALLTSGMKSRAKLEITSRLQIGDSNIPPTITQASGCCTWAPKSGRHRRRNETDAGGKPGHEDLPHPRFRRADDRLLAPQSLVQGVPHIRDKQDAVHRRSFRNREMKPTAADTLAFRPAT